MDTAQFMGIDCLRLANRTLSLLVTRSVGPRILALCHGNGENLFAELPDVTVDCPGAGPFHFYGGHRLWHGPELIRRTYLPDDAPLAVEELANGVLVTQPVEAGTGIQKAMRIVLPDEGDTVVVDHYLTNHGLWPVTCVPWAITQLKLGGTAILPQPVGPADPEGVRPNRTIVLWPYTDVNSPHIRWGNRYILVSARREAGDRSALKLGFPNPAGWIAYHRNDTLLVIKARYLPDRAYGDHGSSSECYCNHQFLELETLGPWETLDPGGGCVHREVWQVFHWSGFEPTEDRVARMTEQLNLDDQVETQDLASLPSAG